MISRCRSAGRHRRDIVHTIFDRALARIGETVHMKHVLRHPVGAGFRYAEGFEGTLIAEPQRLQPPSSPCP